MLRQRNARGAEQAPIDGLIRTRYTLEVCVVCGHERVHTPRQKTQLPTLRRQRPPLVRPVPRPKRGAAMTVVAIETDQRPVPAKLEQEILARIDRAGLHVCEAELRHKLRWNEQQNGSLLDVLDELEHRGLIESALHFRLTDHGRAQLPDDYAPPLRYGTGIPWQVGS